MILISQKRFEPIREPGVEGTPEKLIFECRRGKADHRLKLSGKRTEQALYHAYTV